MEDKAKLYWSQYLETISDDLYGVHIEAGMPGNADIADDLLALFLSGKKTAASGLVRDYELAGEALPKGGEYWIIQDSKMEPRCIVKTIRVEVNRFDQITEEIAKAEGEGDLSIEYWRKAHIDFFTPYLDDWGIEDIEKEMVVTEFYEMVYMP